MFCQRTKEYLSQKGIEFTDRDVTQDESAFDELTRLHAMTTPVTVIGGEVIIGFDPEKLDQALNRTAEAAAEIDERQAQPPRSAASLPLVFSSDKRPN